MLLANPYFSYIYSYLEAINKLDIANFNCTHKYYESVKGDFIYYRCFELESSIQLKTGIILNNAKYYGMLEFSYNKSTKEVYINSVPYVICGDTKIPLFTSDIARIIVERLGKIVPISEIKLVFKEQNAVLIEDRDVVNVLPAISNTRNHQLLVRAMSTIEQEKQKIRDDIDKCKAREERRIDEEERVYRKKRRIYGLDPKEFTFDEFKRRLGEIQTKSYTEELKSLKRIYEESSKAYYDLFLGDLLPEDKERLFSYEYYLLYILVSNLDVSKISKNSLIYSIMEKYHTLTDAEWKSFLNTAKNLSRSDDKTNRIIDLLKYLHDLRESKVEYDGNKLKEVIDIFYDLNDIVINVYNWVVGYVNIYAFDWNDKSTICSGDHSKHVKSRFEIYEEFFGCSTSVRYHPILSKRYRYIQELREKCGSTAKVREELKEQKAKFPELDIMIRLSRLKDKIDYYAKLLEDTPIDMAEKYLKRNILWGRENWGLLLYAPYFIDMQILGKKQGGYDDHCGIIMVKPGVKEMNISNDDCDCLDECEGLVVYVDTQEVPRSRIAKDSDIYGYLHRSYWLKGVQQYIITIPDSLDNESISNLISYTFEADIICVCQSLDTAIRVRQVLAKTIVAAVNDDDLLMRTNINVVVDPNYYLGFVKNAPKIRELWDKYSSMVKRPYSKDYSSRILWLYAFCYDLAVTGFGDIRTYAENYLYRVFNEIAFGGYHNERIYQKELHDFIEYLKNGEAPLRGYQNYIASWYYNRHKR